MIIEGVAHKYAMLMRACSYASSVQIIDRKDERQERVRDNEKLRGFTKGKRKDWRKFAKQTRKLCEQGKSSRERLLKVTRYVQV